MACEWDLFRLSVVVLCLCSQRSVRKSCPLDIRNRLQMFKPKASCWYINLHAFPVFCIISYLISLKGKLTEIYFPSTGSLPKWLSIVKLDWDGARTSSWSPTGWQGSESLIHRLLPSRVCKVGVHVQNLKSTYSKV